MIPYDYICKNTGRKFTKSLALFVVGLRVILPFFKKKFFFLNLFLFGCIGSLLLRVGFL